MKAIKIPYKNGDFDMVILLPKGNSTLKELIKNLESKSVHSLFSSKEKSRVTLSIPKFKFSMRKDLTQYLKSSELKVAFKESSGFINMTNKHIKINNVIQATKIKVNESGTIASAATKVDIGVTAIAPNPKAERLIANRPFIYLIEQANSGLILFIGNEHNPTKNN